MNPITASGTTRDKDNKSFVESQLRGGDFTAREVFVGNNSYQRMPVDTGVEDSFGRLKVAQPHLLFDSHFQYTLQDKVFIRDTLIGSTITHDATRAAVNIACSVTPGSRARFRSRNYFPYSPAFTNTVIGSFNFHGISPGITKRLGMYDEKNGYILEASNGTLRVGVRSSITGSVATGYVDKPNWNIDKMDGSLDKVLNPSGKLFDPTKQNIFYIQFQWLGSGSVTFGIVLDNKIYPFHRFDFAGNLTSLYSQTATLPVQAEILNVSGSSSFMEFTCCSVVSNGALAQHGHLHSASSGSTPKTMTSAGVSVPVISIRKQTAYSDVPVRVLDMAAFSTSQDDFLIQIIHKPTLTGAVWTNIPTSLCQKDVAATAWTGGDIVAEFYMKGNLQASEKLETISRFWDLTLGSDFVGNSEVMTMAATPLTTNANLYGVISFKEFE